MNGRVVLAKTTGVALRVFLRTRPSITQPHADVIPTSLRSLVCYVEQDGPSQLGLAMGQFDGVQNVLKRFAKELVAARNNLGLARRPGWRSRNARSHSAPSVICKRTHRPSARLRQPIPPSVSLTDFPKRA